LLSLIALTSCTEPQQRPNVVLIVIDTLRADRLGCYGHPLDPSPELDALAESGVRFEQVIAPSTWTRPAIASMLTGLHPRTLGIYDEVGDTLADRYQTLAEHFRAGGYYTVGATANPNINAYYGFAQGFDHYLDSDVVFEFMEIPAGGASMVDTAPIASRDLFGHVLRQLPPDAGHAPVFVLATLMEVHEWSRNSMDLRPFDSQFEGRYLRAVRKVSFEIGRFLKELLARDGWQDTIVVITSDHGETLVEHPAVAPPTSHGHLVYETQARVPLIVFDTADRIPGGRTVPAQTRLLDLAPTLLELAGLHVPPGLAGESRAPLASGNANAQQTIAVVETHFRESNKIAVYTPRFKYVETRDGHPGTLPSELHLVGRFDDGSGTDVSNRHPDVARELAQILRRWEHTHPGADPTRAAEPPSEAHRKQLEALGYLQ
jgi:arylsulfatase A-like enzyme